jgi:hypothetical protein
MNYAIKVLTRRMEEDTKEYSRVVTSFKGNLPNDEFRTVTSRLMGRIKELESTIHVLNEFATAEIVGG